MKKRLVNLIAAIVMIFCGLFALSACDKVEFKVNFVVDGAVYATLNTNGEEIIKMPENPTKDDYDFDGWYWDKDTWQTPFTANSLLDAPLSSDMNVYCKWKPKSNDGGNEETKNGLSFKTLSVDGTNVYGKVSNATETFSFLEEITANGASKFVVALDIYGAQQVATKTIALCVGDNIAYIMEMINGETVKMYTVTVRRRPIYTVSFNSNGSTEVQSQQVEEDSFAAEPAAQSKAGYTFEKWNYDFSKPITQNTSVGAVWKAHIDTPYKVQYYLENANDNGYTLHETVDLQGETDTTATAQIKSYEHFSHKSTATDSGNINGNGSLVLKVYYTREMLTVTFNGYGNETETKKVKYGGKVTAPEFTRTGYTQNGWNQPLPETISENLTLSAAWQINQYTLTLVLGGGFENKTITQDYGSAIENIEIPERAGYDFGGWRIDSLFETISFPETMPADNRTYYVRWNAIFNLSASGDKITAITKYGKNKTEIIIPEVIDNVKIISIGAFAFSGCNNLTKLIIPNTVTSIGNSALNGCSVLESITIPFVGEKAGVTTKETGQYPFGYIFGSTSYMGGAATEQHYYGDSIRQTTTSIYYIPISLKNVTVAGGNILYGAFYNCENLTNIMLPKDIDLIESASFYACHSLTSVVLSERITSIGSSAFEYCSQLVSVVIPANVTTIGKKAFNGCYKLVEVINKSNLDIVKGSENYGYIAYNALNVKSYGASDIIDKSGYLFYKYDDTNYLLEYIGDITDLNLPATYNDEDYEIYKYAFYDKKSLMNVTIPNSVTVIHSYAFGKCIGLTNITIPNSVTVIHSYAFLGCSGLSDITLSNSLSVIDAYVFSRCGSLANIVIPSGVKTIGFSAFRGCIKLTNINLPNSVTSIGGSAFSGCSSITSITLPNSVTSIGGSAFSGCSSLTSITLPNSVTSIGGYAFLSCSELRSVGWNAKNCHRAGSPSDPIFSNCTKLEKIVIGKQVEVIPSAAFCSCKALKYVELSDNITSIGSYGFSNCDNLTEIILPKSITSIGEWMLGNARIDRIYYKGTEEEWENISIGDYNYGLLGATRYYYSETKPEVEGNFWHYNDKHEIEEW